ncbi:MAG: glutathione peroxidase [Bacteroidales bacterium]|nr:glutathione peroxidase [Bacteroidales bacterium]
MASIYDFKAIRNNGSELDFADYKGKVIMVVNTASKCGFTPQYKGLEALYQKYKDQGLVIVGFPCDQFAHQEPGDDEQIAQFCEINFGVTFPLSKKVNVNGDDADPLFKYLKSKTRGLLGSSVKWNFTKFLISRDGKRIVRYAPVTTPESLDKKVADLLAE